MKKVIITVLSAMCAIGVVVAVSACSDSGIRVLTDEEVAASISAAAEESKIEVDLGDDKVDISEDELAELMLSGGGTVVSENGESYEVSFEEDESGNKQAVIKNSSGEVKAYAYEGTKASSTTEVPKSGASTTAPETKSAPETAARTPETTKAPETTTAPETTKAPETTTAPETTKAPEPTTAYQPKWHISVATAWPDEALDEAYGKGNWVKDMPEYANGTAYYF